MTSEPIYLLGPMFGAMARISRPKLSGPGTHEGVLLPDGRVAHTSVGVNTNVCDFWEFSAGKPVKVESVLPQALHLHALSVLNDELARNVPYDLLAYNCEIFSRKVVLQEPRSPQVGFWMSVGAVLGIWWLSQQAVAT